METHLGVLQIPKNDPIKPLLSIYPKEYKHLSIPEMLTVSLFTLANVVEPN